MRVFQLFTHFSHLLFLLLLKADYDQTDNTDVVCSVSKQHAVIPSQVFELEDGSSSYKDFAMTRNNRFSSAGQASKNIIQPPSVVLHFYNVPPCVSQDQLLRVRNCIFVLY